MLNAVTYQAAQKSRMVRQKTICNGEETGWQCHHYWAVAYKTDVQNPEVLAVGTKARSCLVVLGDHVDLGDGGSEMAVRCNRYSPSDRPFDPAFERYTPMSPEEIESLYTPEDQALARQAALTGEPR